MTKDQFKDKLLDLITLGFASGLTIPELRLELKLAYRAVDMMAEEAKAPPAA